MTVYLCDQVRTYIGVAADIKPTTGAMGERIPPGSIFKELDTFKEYIWSGTSWLFHVTVTTTSTL